MKEPKNDDDSFSIAIDAISKRIYTYVKEINRGAGYGLEIPLNYTE